jgi:hypothetical protein
VESVFPQCFRLVLVRLGAPAYSLVALKFPFGVCVMDVLNSFLRCLRGGLMPAMFAAFLVAACSSTEQEFQPSDMRVNPMNPDSAQSPTTPIHERIADVMREAKQQYDDGHYPTALHLGRQAESLMREQRYPPIEVALALSIQGYSLLQMGYVDDYYVESAGPQRGALTRFEQAKQLRAEDFRANLGVALALFRRHGDHARKSEVLGEGVISLAVLEQDLPAALRMPAGNNRRIALRQCADKLRAFTRSRQRVVETGYIFHDPYSVKLGADPSTVSPLPIGKLAIAEELLVLQDVTDVLEDALSDAALPTEDIAGVAPKLARVREHWLDVQKHWRMETLKDLQASRDGLLKSRERIPDYFWAYRDLVFVYQALGAFFLDMGLQDARLDAIKDGARDNVIESEARRMFLNRPDNDWAKSNSARNYRDALELTRVFISHHQRFEQDRVARRNTTTFDDDDNSNPFLVDLVVRYRDTMDELIEEERNFRAQMMMEAAVLCFDPLFQINDIPQAILWADRVRTLKVGDPIHHFIRATAQFHGGQHADAKRSYEAFLEDSSITGDSGRRSVARQRILQCERHIERSAGEGGSTSRR